MRRSRIQFIIFTATFIAFLGLLFLFSFSMLAISNAAQAPA